MKAKSIAILSLLLSLSLSDAPATLNDQKISGDSKETGPRTHSKMEIGMNLAKVCDWGSDYAFVDMFKMFRPWLTRSVGGTEWDSGKGNEIPLDENGWPSQVPFTSPSDMRRHYVHSIMTAHIEPGDYTMIVDGTGRLKFWGAANTNELTPEGGTNMFSITIGPDRLDHPLSLIILESASHDHIRNIRLIRPGFEDTYQTQVFHPLYLERLMPFTVLRFMDWGATNGSGLVSWGQRTTAETYVQTRGEGVALEYMILISNMLHKDLWICIPHQAEDDYVRKAAQLLHNSLNPELKIYIEYSNETWNSMFSQTQYVQDHGEALGLDSNRWKAGHRFAALRSAQIWKIFQEVFTDRSRLVKVLATQSANVSVTNTRIAALHDPAINPNHVLPDALAIAPYFGRNFSPSDIPPLKRLYPTADEILDVMAIKDIADTAKSVRDHKAAADKQGLRLICYEGGQHFIGINGAQNDATLGDIIHTANRDPRMYDRYTEYLSMLREYGIDLFIHYNYISTWNKYGSWGALEHLRQPSEDAPKYRALICFPKYTDS